MTTQATLSASWVTAGDGDAANGGVSTVIPSSTPTKLRASLSAGRSPVAFAQAAGVVFVQVVSVGSATVLTWDGTSTTGGPIGAVAGAWMMVQVPPGSTSFHLGTDGTIVVDVRAW